MMATERREASHPGESGPVETGPIRTGPTGTGPTEITRPPLWSYLPCAVLVVVAVFQIVTSLTTDLTSWKGGGFGMFASADGGGNRQVRIYAIYPDGERKVASPRGDRQRAAMLAYPTEKRVAAYANALAEIAERRRSGLEALRVDLWRASFDPATGLYESEPWHEHLLEIRHPTRPEGATGKTRPAADAPEKRPAGTGNPARAGNPPEPRR